MSDIYRRCASIVVFRTAPGGEGFEVLLLKKPRKRDRWQLPQGGIEEGESLEEAALRELKEEAGLHVDVIGESKTVYRYDFPKSFRKFRPDNVCGQHIGFIFAKAASHAAIEVDQKEITAFKWVRPAELPRFLRRNKYLEIVRSLVKEGVLRLRSA